MDPNKIHIDELVRQRLQGGEEEPRPGAWITMRELLDGQMPAGRPIGGLGWGTAARWTTGLVLLTLLAGGYGAMEIRSERRKPLVENSSARVSNGDVASTTNPVTVIGNSSGQLADHSPGKSSDVKPTSSISEATAASLPRATNRTYASARAFRSDAHSSLKESRTSAAQKTVAATASPNNATAQPSSATTTGNSFEASSTPATSPKSRSRRERRAALDAGTRTEKVASTPSPNLTAPAKEKSVKPTRARRVSNALAKNSEAAEQDALSEKVPVVGSASRATAPRNTSSRRDARIVSRNSSNAMDSASVQVQRDTLRPIRIAQRYFPARGARTGRYVADTLAFEPIIIERRIPELTPAPTNALKESSATARVRRRVFARKSKPASTASPVVAAVASSPKAATSIASASPSLIPAASQSLASSATAPNASETLVPLSSLKVSSTKNSKLQYSAQEQIQDAMRKARFAFGQMRLYTGVMGGFNASVGGTSMGGFHAGLFGLLAINDHWSAGVEGKFVQRFNRGNVLQDPYFQYRATNFDQFTTPDGEAYKVYRVTTDSFQHYYKLSTLEAIEIPVYARYSFRRFHGFAGANLAFGLGVKNIERVERFAGRASLQRDTVLATLSYAPPVNTAATVGLNDFGPRFGLGYTAGLGFQASPAVLVDVRMTQLVWDNKSNTTGGLRVSQTFYRVPSLQLSIGYRFSQRKSR